MRLSDLDKAVVAIPAGAWRYGRVIAVAESPSAAPKDRPMVRRNVEAVIRQLNDLGVVVEEWPGGNAQRRYPRERATIFP